MLKNFKKIDTKHTGLFAAGVLFGTAGIKILASEDARKLYATAQQPYFVPRNVS